MSFSTLIGNYMVAAQLKVMNFLNIMTKYFNKNTYSLFKGDIYIEKQTI